MTWFPYRWCSHQQRAVYPTGFLWVGRLCKPGKGVAPKTVPWGTPDNTLASADDLPSSTTFWWCLVRKFLIHVKVLFLMPTSKSLSSRRSCGRVSNALLKSTMIMSAWPFESKVVARSFARPASWVSQESPFLNPCCLSNKTLCCSRWHIIWSWWWWIMCSSSLHVIEVREIGR